MPEAEQRDILAAEPDLKSKWDPTWGDRMNEIVLIGIDLDREAIERQLDACLLTPEEMKLDWSRFRNPLPWAAI
ncbi:putative metal chaperone YciC [Paenibacillus sp. P1XP2]|nr:putative metal chaperone YciC [Paenibacillus sp. P1XP2]